MQLLTMSQTTTSTEQWGDDQHNTFSFAFAEGEGLFYGRCSCLSHHMHVIAQR
jgi:hypothetical protein